MNSVFPHQKSPRWQPAEDAVIVRMCAAGRGSAAEIAQNLPGRTARAVVEHVKIMRAAGINLPRITLGTPSLRAAGINLPRITLGTPSLRAASAEFGTIDVTWLVAREWARHNKIEADEANRATIQAINTERARWCLPLYLIVPARGPHDRMPHPHFIGAIDPSDFQKPKRIRK